MADLDSAMAELEAAGTAQNRKIYTRHGAAEPMFGVSYANLSRIEKPLRRNNALALQLWATGNHDARVLAMRIVDPVTMDKQTVLAWLADVSNYILAEALGGLISQTAFAREISDNLRDDTGEWPASVGWFIVACTAEDVDVWTAKELSRLISQIGAEITQRPNRVRHEMNGALIAMALRDEPTRQKVLTVAERIGPVEVDHGQTGCKTPEIAPYVAKTLAYRAKKNSPTS